MKFRSLRSVGLRPFTGHNSDRPCSVGEGRLRQRVTTSWYFRNQWRKNVHALRPRHRGLLARRGRTTRNCDPSSVVLNAARKDTCRGTARYETRSGPGPVSCTSQHRQSCEPIAARARAAPVHVQLDDRTGLTYEQLAKRIGCSVEAAKSTAAWNFKLKPRPAAAAN